jgi:hypothetical protein
MGFMDKLFGGKEGGAGAGSHDVTKGWLLYEDKNKGFRFSYPPEWMIKETARGVEIYRGESPRILDPALGEIAASPRVVVAWSDVSDPGLNTAKDFIRTRPAEFEGYKFIKHHTSKVANAKYGTIYEFYYGPQDSLFRALSAVAQKKDRFFHITAFGTADDFFKQQSILESVVFSFQLI